MTTTKESWRPVLLSRLMGVGPEKAQAILECLRDVSALDGNVCELGVAQGCTSALIANEISDEPTTLHLFDTFAGLPAPSDKDKLLNDIFSLGSMVQYTGQMACPRMMVEARLREIGFPSERVAIHAGELADTLKGGTGLPSRVKFAFLDVDFYEGTRDGLAWLDRVAVPGCIVVVDDYGFFSSGAQTAVDEFLAAHRGQWTADVRNYFVILKRVASATQTVPASKLVKVAPALPTIDIVVKTFPGDYEWLPSLWRSIAKYATGWREIVVIIEEQYDAPPLPERARLVRCRRYEGTECSAYNGVAIERLGAWRHSDADVLVFVDSDCVFCRPVDLQTDPTIFQDGKPVLLWADRDDTLPQARWLHIARETLGWMPWHFAMIRYPFVFARDTVRSCWYHCGGEERLVRTNVTDWEVLGNFALRCDSASYAAKEAQDAGPASIWQFWNRGGAFHPLTEEQVREHGMGGGARNAGVQVKLRELGLA